MTGFRGPMRVASGRNGRDCLALMLMIREYVNRAIRAAEHLMGTIVSAKRQEGAEQITLIANRLRQIIRLVIKIKR